MNNEKCSTHSPLIKLSRAYFWLTENKSERERRRMNVKHKQTIKKGTKLYLYIFFDDILRDQVRISHWPGPLSN